MLYDSECESRASIDWASSAVNAAADLSRWGVLSEYKVRHPALPFVGIIDLVRRVDGDIVITDFKTGAEKDLHRSQVELYALVSFRLTGAVPAQLEICYTSGITLVDISESRLKEVERDLERRI